MNSNYLARVRARLLELYYLKIYRRPFWIKDRMGLVYKRELTDNLYDYFLHHGYNEVKEQLLINQLVQTGDVAVDVGANIGVYTLQLAKLVGNTGSVIAIEPESNNVRRLKENLRHNHLQNVRVITRPAYHKLTKVRFNVFSQVQYGWHTLGNPQIEYAGELAKPIKCITLSTTTLDSIFTGTKKIPIKLVKVDVEGAELDVLLGASTLLKRRQIEYILFEVSQIMVDGMHHTNLDIIKLLDRYHYSCHLIKADGTIGRKITRFSKTYDNYLAKKI